MSALLAFGLLISGCGDAHVAAISSSAASSSTGQAPSAAGEKLMLASDPGESQSVIEAREGTKDGEPVVLTGRIGGSLDPWVKGRAAFQIVDASLVPCNEKTGDSCPTPWDYCCDADRLSTSIATIKFVNEQGQTLSTDARELFGVSELQTVVVQGRAKRDDAGNLTVLADKLFVKAGSTLGPPPQESHSHDGHPHEHGAEHKHSEESEAASTTPAAPPAGELP